MGDIINGVASEYEMPREPKFYPDDSKLPRTNWTETKSRKI